MSSETRVKGSVTWGLLAAWVVHDAEEALTMARWVGAARPRLESRFPRVPARVWDRLAVTHEHAVLAIGVMGCLVAAAAADGARTGGRSPLFQAVVVAFGAHTASHLTASAVTGGYTPGVVTAPAVAAPFSFWAWRQLRRAGVATAPVPPAALALFPASIAFAHGTASLILRTRHRLSRRVLQ